MKKPGLKIIQTVGYNGGRTEFKFSGQESNLAPYFGNGTKVKIPSEIKPPLIFIPILFWLFSMIKSIFLNAYELQFSFYNH